MSKGVLRTFLCSTIDNARFFKKKLALKARDRVATEKKSDVLEKYNKINH